MISRASSRRRTGSPNSFVVIAPNLPPREPPYRRESRAMARLRRPCRGSGRPPESPGHLGVGVPGLLHRGGGVVNGLLDVGVARAPAEVAADHVVHLLL